MYSLRWMLRAARCASNGTRMMIAEARHSSRERATPNTPGRTPHGCSFSISGGRLSLDNVLCRNHIHTGAERGPPSTARHCKGTWQSAALASALTCSVATSLRSGRPPALLAFTAWSIQALTTPAVRFHPGSDFLLLHVQASHRNRPGWRSQSRSLSTIVNVAR